MSTSLETELDSLLKQSQDKSWKKPLPQEISQLICAFLPSQSAELRSKAYLVLSTVCQHIRETSPAQKEGESDHGTESLAQMFLPPTSSRLAELKDDDYMVALSFLVALFQVDWRSAAAIFVTTVLETIDDLIDLSPSKNVSVEIARVLSQACAHKSCREQIPSYPRCIKWLEQSIRQTEIPALRSSAAIALIKYSRGHAADAAEIPGTEKGQFGSSNEKDLVKLMTELVVDDQGTSFTDAIEGLAYMTIDPDVKETLSKDVPFLTRLFGHFSGLKKSQVTQTSPMMNSSQIYGAAVTISNICMYRPRLSQEQAQVAKLKAMSKTTSGGKLKEAKDDPRDDDSFVKKRCRRLVEAGVVGGLSALARLTESRAVFLHIGKALLSLAEDKENRGIILQSGGSKTLMKIIRAMLPSSSSSKPPPQAEESILDSIQALAKLAITASPVQVFGPDEGSSLDAVRPLSLMLVHPAANLLQQFESLMALTNLSSASPAVATRIAKAEGLMNKTELLLLEDHVLVRRAAMELICNLITGCDEVFETYGGGDSKKSRAKSKLQILVALSDVEDGATRLAASGALATVTASPNACKTLADLQNDRHRVFPILTQLIDHTADESPPEDPLVRAGLAHRGVICIRNMLLSVEDSSLKSLVPDAESSGLVAGLVGVIKSSIGPQGAAILQPAAEALKRLIDGGASAG